MAYETDHRPWFKETEQFNRLHIEFLRTGK
jgi:hypothetical protein